MVVKKKTLGFIISCVIVLLALVVFIYVRSITSTGFDIQKTVYIKIDENRDYQLVVDQIENVAHVRNVDNFKKIASFLRYSDNVKSGRYAITADMDVLEVVRMLKNAHQAPVRLTFNNIRTKDDLTTRLSEQLMLSKEILDKVLNDPEICAKYGFTPETVDCMFVPNTYEIYWNISIDKFLARMNTEYKKFWNTERIQKAKNMNLPLIEVSVLASIVEEECYFSDEYPVVAGLYLNRLRQGMLLQADPTVKYAVGDFSIRRVLHKHLETDSPYNTYKYLGLPPGPIRVPSIKAIDGVLNNQSHSYIYMCAKEDFSGRHNFAVTFADHQKNASKYQAALNVRKIN